MGNIAQIQGTRELTAEFESLQNGRWRLTRRVMLQGAGNVDDATFKSLGALLSAEYAVKGDETKFANLVLVREGVGTDIVNRAQAVVWTGVYETLTGSFVGEVDDKLETVENGLERITRVLIAKAGTSYGSYVVGTSTYSGLTLAQRLVEENDAYVRVTLVYGASGVIDRSVSTRNNGALETLVIESANEVPATPSGYALINTQVVGELGFETTRYTFVKGFGEIIGQVDETRNNGALFLRSIRYIAEAGTVINPISTPSGYVLVSEESTQQDGYVLWSAQYAKGSGEISRETQGQGDGVVVSIRHLAAPSASNPISTPSGYLKLSETYQEDDGYRIWSAVYAKGEDVTDYDLNGLKRITRTLFAAAGTSTAGFVVGTQTYGSTPTLYLAKVRIEDNGIYQRVVAEYLEPGVVDTTVQQAEDGLLFVTFRSFYTKITPTALNGAYSLTDLPNLAFQGGAAASLFRQRVENVLGYKVWSVTSMMKADGSVLAIGSDNELFSYQNWVQYEKPGTLDVSSAANGPVAYPGNTRWVKATVSEVLTTIGTISGTSFKPYSVTEWASYRVSYTPVVGAPVVESKGASGYLADSAVTVSSSTYAGVSVVSAVATAASSPTPATFYALNNQVIGCNQAPAFVTDDGVKWYRRKVLTVDGTFSTYLS